MVNYAVGSLTVPGKQKKVKRTGPPPAGKKEGEISKETRMLRFNTPAQKKKVATTLKINTNSKQAVDQGLERNEYGLPTGEQKQKQFRLKKSLAPKFRK